MNCKHLFFSFTAIFGLLFGHVNTELSAKSHCHSNEKKDSLPPWIEYREGTLVYKFNVFNLDPANINQKKLKSIFKAIEKDTWINYAKDNARASDIKVYKGDQVTNPKLFKGDRIPIYIGNFQEEPVGNFLGYHVVQTPPDFSSFFLLNENITQLLGVPVPSNFPNFTPYSAVNSGTIKEWLGNGHWAGNPYAFNTPSKFYQVLSVVGSHEVHEILGDDSGSNFVIFDNTAPTVANWHYAILDEDGNPTNGTVGPDGYVHLPYLTDFFPDGIQISVVREDGDAVSRSTASKLQTYYVDGWAIQNYPLYTFWQPWYTSSSIKYDKKGLSKLPCQPFAGLHEPFLVYILDLGDGLFGPGESQFAQVLNWGPVTSTQREAEQKANRGPGWNAALNNFPPDYTYVTFFGPISAI